MWSIQGKKWEKEHISEACSITNLNGNYCQIWQNWGRHFYHGNRQNMTDGKVWESFSERLCLSTDRFQDWMCCEEQPAWAVSLRELHCVLPAKIVYLSFFCVCVCKSQPNQSYEVVYGTSRNILNSWSTMENSGFANYLTTTEKWLCFPGQSFKW